MKIKIPDPCNRRFSLLPGNSEDRPINEAAHVRRKHEPQIPQNKEFSASRQCGLDGCYISTVCLSFTDKSEEGIERFKKLRAAWIDQL